MMAWTGRARVHPDRTRPRGRRRGCRRPGRCDSVLTMPVADLDAWVERADRLAATFAATAVHRDGGWVLEGRKTWSTWLPVLTHAVVTARVDRPDAGPAVAGFVVDLSLRGVGRDPTFDALGLRATASGALLLNGVRVGE